MVRSLKIMSYKQELKNLERFSLAKSTGGRYDKLQISVGLSIQHVKEETDLSWVVTGGWFESHYGEVLEKHPLKDIGLSRKVGNS